MSHWLVLAAYFTDEHVRNNDWLGGMASSEHHDVRLLARDTPIGNWHERKTKFTPPTQWLKHLSHAEAALSSDADGVITLFQHLPAILGLRAAVRPTDTKVISWMFSVPNLDIGPVRSWLTRTAMKNIDKIVVHSTKELELYAEWLGLPESQFEFVHYTTDADAIQVWVDDEPDEPFVAALGSAHRDFRTFFDAVEQLELPTIVAAGRPALADIEVPALVQTPFDITRADCHRIAQHGRVNVVPLAPKPSIAAAGYVTVVEGMYMGRPLIVSDCYSMRDYVIHEETGILVKPNDVNALRDAIERLWHDEDLRKSLGENAKAYAHEHFSEKAASRALHRMMDELTPPATVPGNGTSGGSKSGTDNEAGSGDDTGRMAA